MDSPERRDALKEQVAVVYRMGEGDLRAMTEGRLRAWLRMDRQTIRPLADDFESVLDEMPADVAMRRVTVVQLVSGQLSPEERQALRDLVPKVLGNEPPPIDGTAAAQEPARRPWWAFWRR